MVHQTCDRRHQVPINYSTRFDLNHIFRKGNSVVDGMVTLGFKVKGLRCWRDLNALPKLVSELVKNDES